MNEFATLEEAQAASLKMKPYWFCPLINGPCRVDCYCFEPANVVKQAPGKYLIRRSFCNNVMFTGEN